VVPDKLGRAGTLIWNTMVPNLRLYMTPVSTAAKGEIMGFLRACLLLSPFGCVSSAFGLLNSDTQLPSIKDLDNMTFSADSSSLSPSNSYEFARNSGHNYGLRKILK
jgi:hypothetical protein